MRRVQHTLVADSLNNAPVFEATRRKRLIKTIPINKEKNRTSASRRLHVTFSQRRTSVSFKYRSTSDLYFSSLNRAASSAPLNDASCVWADKEGGGVFVPEEGVGGRLGVGARRVGVPVLP